MNARILLALALGACIASSSSAATLDARLIEAFESGAPSDWLPVLVLLEDTADLASLRAKSAALRPAQRQEAVAQALQAHAAATQAPLRAAIARSLGHGKAARVRSLWTVNALAFEADYELVQTLAAIGVDARIVLDERFDMLSAVTASRLPTDPAVAKVPVIAWNVDWIHAPDAWALGYTGDGVVVAHIDSGVDQSHSDLQNRLWVNPGEIPDNQIDDDDNGYVDDVHGYDFANDDADPEDDGPSPNGGHGTHTAGTVAGDGTGGTSTGVAPGASVMVCKVFPSGAGGAAFSDIYAAHQYALANGARLITQSLGVAGDEDDIPDWLMRTERVNGDAIRTAGVVLFAAAGNDHFLWTPPYELGVTARVPSPWTADPAPYSSRSGVISVGGTHYQSNAVYESSSRGHADWSGINPWNDWPSLVKPDIAAPGVGVNSTMRAISGEVYSGDTWSGTSMSTPHVAGVAALMLDKNPTLTPEQISEILETTAVDLGDAGKDNTFGAGLLDALAAVNAVPATSWPYLVHSGLTFVDAGGDGVIDPGEDFELVFELTNNSTLVDGTSVAASLSVATNPHVTVVDAAATFPDIELGGGAQSNSSDTFGLTSAVDTPQGYEFAMDLTVTAADGYETVFDVKLFVGLPNFLDHDVGAVVLTVTDRSTLGYLSDDQLEGSGFGPAGSTSSLFIGSLWAGTDASYVCNSDYSGSATNPERHEWRTLTDPNGRMQKLGAVKSDQDYRSMYDDAGASPSKKVQVTQRSFAWAEEGYNEFVMVLYTITNNGGTVLSDWHAGIFCDWDVGDAATNLGKSEAGRQVSYIYGGGKHAGIAYLGDDRVSNLSMINNETHVYPNSKINDATKIGFLKGRKSAYQVPMTKVAGDWSAITAVGPFDLGPGETVHLPFAVVYGAGLEAFQSNVDMAHERWQDSDIVAIAPVPPGETPPPVENRLALAQNRPNPFNPSTTIFFSTEQGGPVRLVVYDLAGRQVRTLADREFESGDWSVTWDGRDDAGRAMSSGLYLYRLEAGNRVLSRKMMLVK